MAKDRKVCVPVPPEQGWGEDGSRTFVFAFPKEKEIGLFPAGDADLRDKVNRPRRIQVSGARSSRRLPNE